MYLHRHANIRVVEAMRARVPLSGFLRERLVRLALQKGYKMRRSLGVELPKRAQRIKPRMEQDWIDSCAHLPMELYSARGAVRSIGAGYFDGHEQGSLSDDRR